MLRTKTRAVLSALGSHDAEVSILITDDPAITELNARYLDRTGPTNVIAFPMLEGDFAEINPAGLLGDVVISADTAHREAREAGISMEERFTELLVHGILHLLGYDHETDEADARVMEAKTRELMEMLKRAEDTAAE
ncbi:MAG: rRNA maturation RNase YbeY [Thermodesulfobacteriota bacterium]|nr:rRNA maturation RNase YbeY [Thermodesulfobacteriota bacterium]